MRSSSVTQRVTCRKLLLAVLLQAALTAQGQVTTDSSSQVSVHPGDYLCNITNTYNVSFAALLAVNNASTGSPVIDPQTLQLTSNMQLNVPHIPPQNCCPNFTYAVKAGESFFEISQRFSVDLAVLEEDNNHGPSNDQLTCGDQLVVRCQAGQPICQVDLPATPSPAPVVLPLPFQKPPPPAPFPAKTYTFRLSQFQALKTPDGHDSDYVTVFCYVNGVQQPNSPTSSTDLETGQGQGHTRWYKCNAQITAPTDIVTVGWIIVNDGHGIWGQIVDKAVDFASGLTKAITTATGPETSIWGNVITSVLGLGKDIFDILDQDCDGIVGADAQAYRGGDLDSIIAGNYWNTFSRSYTRRLCDATFIYQVYFDILPCCYTP